MNIKDTIEGLLGKKKECNPYGALIHLKSAHGYNEMYFKAVKVVEELLKYKTAQKQSEGMLKKKKLRKETMVEDGARQENACIEPYNEAISIAQPILAKKILRIAELEQKLIDKNPKI